MPAGNTTVTYTYVISVLRQSHSYVAEQTTGFIVSCYFCRSIKLPKTQAIKINIEFTEHTEVRRMLLCLKKL